MIDAYLAACKAANERPNQDLAAALGGDEGDSCFRISGMALSDATVHCVAEGLKAGHSFTESELTELQLSPRALGELVQSLASGGSLMRLSIADCGLGDEGALAVLPVVRAGSLSTLELRSNRIGNPGASSLAEALAGNSALRSIDLQRNDIKDQGAIGLAAALQVNGALQVVNLRFNEVGDAGATALGKALQSNRSIVELHLGGNLIGPEGAMQLAASLEANSTLRTLNLRSNAILDVGAVAIARMCKRNDALVELYLGSNGIGEEGCAALADSWKHNSRLQRVDLQGASCGRTGALAVAEALRVNRTLKQLVLEIEPNNREGATAVANALRSNTTITELALGEAVHEARLAGAALTGVNTRMEQLAAAMEVRLQAHEAQLMRLHSDLHTEREKTKNLETHVAELLQSQDKARHELSRLNGELLEKGRDLEQLRQELRWVDEAAAKARAHEEAERRAAVDGLHSQLTKLAEAQSSHMADTDAAARGAAESLEAVRDEMKRSFGESAARLGSVERAGQHATEQLRAAFAEAQAAREVEVVELTEAQAATAQKLSDELRWVDEEHMRCRAEDDQKVSAALEAVREETRGALEELRAQVSEAIVPLGEPGALSTLQQALLRVDTLGEAVAQLCAYMQSLKIKEVASAAEARLAELEGRLTGGGTMVPAALDHRISQLEIALHEEQQSTLRALQAIVESQQAPH
ncbi:hypothetical protein Ctob_001958 [Chrysochromulina tobinii]|uniref:Protein nlrc3 n=1 Tax=Chrysochromulina tobinii TaxID=1460289 RepID=A0A0M0J4G6_9EUKA|nr:hypothetical protein Ctob_001958 [Chrysochromulina tobinii]|eukprot:KOO21484.1 hypothetical protein Ctob_001958 [Chrysochromulina sp. CCMP291]